MTCAAVVRHYEPEKSRSRASIGGPPGGIPLPKRHFREERCHGQEKRGRRLPDRRCRRRERDLLGGCRPASCQDGIEIAARPAHRGGREDGHEGGGWEGGR